MTRNTWDANSSSAEPNSLPRDARNAIVNLSNNSQTNPLNCNDAGAPLDASAFCVFLGGPTSAGKSAVAIALAQRIGGEIVGADAFQIYRGLPILTAQPPEHERAGIPHHLIGEIPPDQPMSTAAWLRLATERIRTIRNRGRTPIIVGGTGLYLKALACGLDDIPPPSPELRARLSALSLPDLLAGLRKTDPEALSHIDTHNRVRVQRALEICLTTGRPLAESRSSRWKNPPPLFGAILTRDRDDLHRRIDASVHAMFRAGVVEEVRALGSVGPAASRAIGYKEVALCAAGQLSTEEAITRIQLATRQYAKRQLTWFRHQLKLPVLNLSAQPDPASAAQLIATPAEA